jgi:hypothetical protein
VITSTRSWVKSGRGRVCVIAFFLRPAFWALRYECRGFAASSSIAHHSGDLFNLGAPHRA